MKKQKMSFGGVLQPLVHLLETNPRNGGTLYGKSVVLPREDVKAIIALDSGNNLHLLISPVIKEDVRLTKLSLKGLKIENTKWAVANLPVQKYLDISCATGTLPIFKRPFLRFAEDVLFEISESNMLPSDAVYSTGIRWKKFWSPEESREVTKEWIHGLFGELLFLIELINRFGTDVLDCWTGPYGKDHDFQKGDEIAAEIKTSIEIPFSINCNLHQLDPELFRKLYIVCYLLSPSENGSTLTELVRNIEKLIGDEENYMEKFYGQLNSAGYHPQSEPIYNEFKLKSSKASIFRIDGNFPKIIEKSFINPPDHRITGIRYTLQLIGLEELTIDSIATELNRFAKQ